VEEQANSPITQFEIKTLVPMRIGDLDVSFTNSSLMMLITIAAATVFLVGGMRKHAMVPGRWQLTAEISYEFIAGMLRDNVGKEGRPYFPLVFSLFMFILFGNMLGMLPYSFTFTSHIIVTFALAITIFIGVTVLAFVKHGVGFFKFFAPEGIPILIMPLLIPIEIISYLSRPISLSVRLFANMMAGHTLMKVFGGFVVQMKWFGILPLTFLVALTGLEMLIAFLQAYVFAILTCLYINDALHIH
jgi:F-type H+-transporting ATPase subunit a